MWFILISDFSHVLLVTAKKIVNLDVIAGKTADICVFQRKNFIDTKSWNLFFQGLHFFLQVPRYELYRMSHTIPKINSAETLPTNG